MAYDEGLAERIRQVLEDRRDVVEKRMFGGIAFMVAGHMSVGIIKDQLMVRVGPAAYEGFVKEPHARPMDFTRRPMVGFLYVAPDGVERDEDLERWVARGVAHATSRPAKTAAAAVKTRARRRS
jgi:TfoX/Sxy family transcriptional regulator of competence genes